MKRANIRIKGNVQMAGFQTFIKNTADSLSVTGFADNLPDGSVNIVCEGREEAMDEFVDSIKQNLPSFASIEAMDVAYEEYKGEFTGFERRGADIPGEGSEMLTVMKSFDKKAEKMVSILSSMNEGIKSVKGDTSQMLEKRDVMIEKQDQMLDKQDKSIAIIKSGNETLATKQDETIATIKSDVDEMREFRTETQQNFANLDIKYGKIAENMERIMKSMEDTSRKTGEVLERLAQQQENFNTSIDKLTDAILTLAKRSR